MKRTLIAAILIAVPFAASAASGDFKGKCSMTASKTTKKAELEKMAKVKHDAAKKIAQDSAGGGVVSKGGIETEDGCLVYSFHVKDTAGKGQTEVFVDAGDGKILKTEKEGAVRTALEKPVDVTKAAAGARRKTVTGTPSTNQAAKK